MKKRSFLAGMLTMALVGGLGFSALAATGQVSFNASALSLNGTQVSAKGENYTLANGQSVPSSITYTDEKGGGTTYLPVRRISELLGVETGWDGAAGAVTVKGEVKAPETTTPPADYSDWSAEDEAAYQEFKGYWNVDLGPQDDDLKIPAYHIVATLKNQQDTTGIAAIWNIMSADHRELFATRLIEEYITGANLSPLPGGYFAWLKKPGSGWIAGVTPPSRAPGAGTRLNVQHHDFD